MGDFDTAVEYVLQNEQGFVDNPDDLGAATNYGISTAMLASARGCGVTRDDVQNLSLDEAKQIYKKYFWDKLELGDLKEPVATAIFDMAVNMGEKRAVFFAQLVCGQKNPDGIMGPQTKQQLNAINSEQFIRSYIGYVQDYYCDVVTRTAKQAVFIKGWIRRALKLMTLVPIK